MVIPSDSLDRGLSLQERRETRARKKELLMELPSWVITTLTLASIVLGLLWVSTIVRSQAKAFDRARALVNGVAEDFRLGRVNPKEDRKSVV